MTNIIFSQINNNYNIYNIMMSSIIKAILDLQNVHLREVFM